MSGRPTRSVCFTCTGNQSSENMLSWSAGLVPTGKIRPSSPMSPTCTLFGIPPSAITAQFSNSKCGNALSFSIVHGRSRTTKALGLCDRHNGSLSFIRHTSRSRLAITRQAVGEMSMPIH